MEKVSNFWGTFHTIVDKFKNASISEKTTILNSIGSNLSLLDGKLSISLNKELNCIKKLNSIINQDSDRLEPLNFGQYKQKTKALDSRFTMMLRVLEDVRTCLVYPTP
jgi:hypothetical protein